MKISNLIVLLMLFTLTKCCFSQKKNNVENKKIKLDSLTIKTITDIKEIQIDSNIYYRVIGQYLNNLFLKALNSKADDINLITLFQRNYNNIWIDIDSLIKNEIIISAKITDINDDSIPDLIICNVFGIYNIKSNVFLCDKNNYLHFRKDFNLFFFDYNKKNKTIKNYYQGGTLDPIDLKELYIWKNDSLELIKSVDRQGGYYSDKKNIVVTFYKISNGQKQIEKRLINPPEKLFDNALWKSDSEFFGKAIAN